MRKLILVLLAFACTVTLMSLATAQPAAGKRDDPAKDYSNSSIVVKMMAFNAKKDGKLTKEELTDRRLHRLFDQADANKDGVVTREELMVLAAKLEAEIGPGGPGGKGPRGKGGFDDGDDKGPKDKGPGGFGGKGPKGKGQPPRPGQILPNFIQDQLNLTSTQRTQLDALQKEVDTKLGKILTEEQRDHLKEMQQRGPGGPGGKGPPPK